MIIGTYYVCEASRTVASVTTATAAAAVTAAATTVVGSLPFRPVAAAVVEPCTGSSNLCCYQPFLLPSEHVELTLN